MTAYYNEIDPFAAAWLRELIKAGHIADGEVDERSIELVQPGDVRGFTQCHFFAGIGGWSYALRLAGWPDDREVWTGSCPCQPFSQAGRGATTTDPRHLWPTWFRLIGECRPVVVFGEQVASADGVAWLDLVLDNLEAEGYAVGPFDLPACGAGAPNGRPRIYFVGDRGWTDADGLHEHGRIIALEMGRQRSQTKDETVPVTPGNLWAAESRPAAVDYGLPADVARGCANGYGNSISPQVAQVFLESYLDCKREPMR